MGIAPVLGIVAVVGVLGVPGAPAEEPLPTITVGEVLTLRSQILGEERRALVHLPIGYADREERYPVLYMTDGEDQFLQTVGTTEFLARVGRIPQLIVIGVTNTDRTRDLTPTRAAGENGGRSIEFPTSGGADRFLDFLQQELIPRVEQRYRTRPYRIFAGHSFGGLFATHALLSRPDLFNAYLAVSPSLNWDADLPVRRARDFFAGRKDLPRTYFVTLGHEPRVEKQFEELRRILRRSRASGFTWDSAHLTDEDHGSVVLLSHYLGLRKVFEDWTLPLDKVTGTYQGGPTQVREHYARLSERLGWIVPPPEAAVNALGYAALGRSNAGVAVEFMALNVAGYPDSANARDSLGEALEALGRLEEARDSYAKAVELGRKGDPNLAAYQQHLDAIGARLAKRRQP